MTTVLTKKAPRRTQKEIDPFQASGPVVNTAAPTAGAMATAVTMLNGAIQRGNTGTARLSR